MNIHGRNVERKAWGLAAILIGGAAGWLSPMVSHAASCGGFGNQTELSKYYRSAHKCGTCAGQDANTNYCSVLNRMMKFDPDGSGADVVLIPHRGIWGGLGASGASENTMGALKAAENAGYQIVEIDAMLSEKTRSSSSAPYTGEQIRMSHYFDMYAYGGNPGDNPRTTPGLSAYKMNKRNGVRSGSPDDGIASINDAIAYAVSNNLMLTVDPKVPDKSDQIDLDSNAPDANEYAAIVGAVLHAAKTYGETHGVDALGHITIKSTFTAGDLVQRMAVHHYLPTRFSDYWGRFLWSPIVNKSSSVDKDSMKAALDKWFSDICVTSNQPPQNTSDPCVYPQDILTVETQIYNESHWTSGFDLGGKHYASLIKYVQDYTKNKGAARRATLWSVDPMGHLGTLSRQYTWKFIGNDIAKNSQDASARDDLRSNPVFLISRAGATRSAIITDRPDVYESMVTQ